MASDKATGKDGDAGSVANPLFESMEGMLKQLSLQGAGGGKSAAEVKVKRPLSPPPFSSQQDFSPTVVSKFVTRASV